MASGGGGELQHQCGAAPSRQGDMTFHVGVRENRVDACSRQCRASAGAGGADGAPTSLSLGQSGSHVGGLPAAQRTPRPRFNQNIGASCPPM